MAGIRAVVRLRLPAGTAKPGPSIGQALGPLGLNMMEFCQEFNKKTSHLSPDILTPAILTAYNNRTFDFVTRTPPTTWFLKQCSGVTKGAQVQGLDFVGSISLRQVYEIAKMKQMDEHMARQPLKSVCRSVMGSAKSMGIEIVDDRHLDGDSTDEAGEVVSEKGDAGKN